MRGARGEETRCGDGVWGGCEGLKLGRRAGSGERGGTRGRGGVRAAVKDEGKVLNPSDRKRQSVTAQP